MSILSKFLKRMGTPEIKLESNEIFGLFKNEIVSVGAEKAFKNLTVSDLEYLKSFIDSELKRRKNPYSDPITKAGI